MQHSTRRRRAPHPAARMGHPDSVRLGAVHGNDGDPGLARQLPGRRRAERSQRAERPARRRPRARLPGSEQAIQDFTEARLKELEERYAAYDMILAGTACCLQLNSDLDLSAAHAPSGARARRDHPKPTPIMPMSPRIEIRLAAAVLLPLLAAGCASQRQAAPMSHEPGPPPPRSRSRRAP